MEIGETLTDADFPAQPGLVPAGEYLLKVISKSPSIAVSKAGNRMLSFGLVTVTNEAGEAVRSKPLNKRLPIDGVYTRKDGTKGNNREMFIGFLSALGFNRDDITDIYATLASEAPAVVDIDNAAYAAQELKIRGDVIDFKGLEVMGTVAVTQYNGADQNELGFTKAVKSA